MNTRRKPVVLSTIPLAAMLIGTTAAGAATTCEGLINLPLTHGQITAAQTVTGGTFNTPPGCTTGCSARTAWRC